MNKNFQNIVKPTDFHTNNFHESRTLKRGYILKRLWGYLKKTKLLLLLALLLTIGSNCFSLIGPSLSGKAINVIELGVGNVDFSSVLKYVILMIVFYVLSVAMSYLLSILMINISRDVVYRMRKDVFDKLQRLPIEFFDKHQTGDILSIISYDIDTVNASLSNDLVQVFASVITVIGSFYMMLKIKPILVMIFVVTIPISIFFTRFMAKKVRPLFKFRSAKLGKLNGFSEEYIGGLKTTKAYGREETIIGRFDKKNTEAANAYYKADYYGSLTGPSVNFINNISLAFVSIFGAILYLNKSISLGNISSFVLYSRKFSGPINELANILSEFQSAFAAAERVFRILDEKEEKYDDENATELENVKGEIEFKNVSFGYDKNKIILKNLNLSAKSGSLIAIVGPTGAGKTTIINLLMRFYDADSGEILIDGKELKSVTRKSLRLSYSMVLQDTWLFYGTIFENLSYGKENVTRKEVENAAKAAKIHDYIMQLPDGYDTILSDNGVNISKGQKQLLTIARAYLLNAKMLILDEATSNVDTQTEMRIQEAMSKLMKNKTCFVIAHRLSTIKNADTILVVKDGNIVESGNHTELMLKKGFYYELYNSQFE